MVKFWQTLRGKPTPPSREEVDSVQAREVSEAARQRLERAIKYRKREVNGLVEGVLPKRGIEQ